MSELAEFMTLREKTRWQVTQDTAGSQQRLSAQNETSLKSQTWMFDKASAQALTVTQGSALISDAGDKWMVKAGDCRELVVKWLETRSD